MSGLSYLRMTRDPLPTDDADAGFEAGASEWVNKLTGVRFTCIDATLGAAIWQRDRLSNRMWLANKYRWPDYIFAFDVGGTETGKVFAHLLKIDHRVQIDRLAVYLATAQSGAVGRLALAIPNATTGLPGTVIAGSDGGEFDFSTGGGAMKEKAIAAYVSAGHIYTLSQCAASGTVPTFRRASGVLGNVFPSDDLAEIVGSNPTRYLEASRGYAAFVGGADLTSLTWNKSTGTAAPIIGARRAA